MEATFEITHDRNFLQHFLTRWRTLSISPEMVETLRLHSEKDPYAAYGYGRWLYFANPDGNSLKEAELRLTYASTNDVVDATAALSEMFYDGSVEADEAMHEIHAFLMQSSYQQGSELAQYLTLLNTIYGDYGYPKDPAQVADILKGHLEKNPDSDTIYWDLQGLALENGGDTETAVKAYETAIGRGETESYYSLAHIYLNKGDKERAYQIAREGAEKGSVNCRRFKALMEEDDFKKLTPEEQKTFHKEVAEGLDYAIEHYDRYACFLKSISLYNGELGFKQDSAAAIAVLRRGCELGSTNCFHFLAAIQHDDADTLPPELLMKPEEYSKLCLQAIRMDNDSSFLLEQVARAYVSGILPKHEEEIEKYWLKKYHEVSMKDADDDNEDAIGVIKVYPQGFYYAKDVETEEFESTKELAALIDADGVDIVHYSDLLTRISKALCLEGCHVAMAVDRDGYMKDLPDNMTGTIIYGHGMEIRGTVIFLLEDDKYNLKPFKGLQLCYMFLKMLRAATHDLMRDPNSEELEAIGADDTGGFEEYDDFEDFDDEMELPDEEDDEDDNSTDEPQDEGMKTEGITVDDDDAEPQTFTATLADLGEVLKQCNLCRDTLFLAYPNDSKYDFMRTDELFYALRIKDAVEKNIERHGGYMIDEWQYVDKRQVPTDIRWRVRLKAKEK